MIILLLQIILPNKNLLPKWQFSQSPNTLKLVANYYLTYIHNYYFVVFALVQKLLNSHSKNEHPASIHNIKCQLEKLHRVHKLVQWYTIYLT